MRKITQSSLEDLVLVAREFIPWLHRGLQGDRGFLAQRVGKKETRFLQETGFLSTF